MSQPYVGEIRMVGFNFAPNGWALCDGSLLPIAEYETLFNLIGTTYGGDGQQTFALPDLRGRVPVHAGANGFGSVTLAERGGAETVTLTTQQMPQHTHAAAASTAAAVPQSFRSAVLAAPGGAQIYGSGAASTTMGSGALAAAGNGLPHDNMAPSLTVNFVISLFGIFPSQT